MKWLVALAVIAVIGLCWPDGAHAWTPGTHVVLSERILGSLHLLVPAAADLLRAYPYDFLYGSIAADTTMAKKFAPADRHCHAWHVGREVYDLAPTDALRAFGLGYLSHLAADVVAHNHFVPRQLVLSSSTRTAGHTYWESRVETELGQAVPRAARELIRLDHRQADAHLERILSPTIFSVRTNRRLFRGMVHLTDSRPWQVGMQVAADQSRWELPEETIEAHLDRAVAYIRGTLNDPVGALQALDPNGEAAIVRSKEVRRQAMRGPGRRDREWIVALAEAQFGITPADADPHLRALQELGRPDDEGPATPT
ncbi:MAG: zinc dependent phospholipase C family protein [Gemmatimonadales bacterium]